MILCLNINAFWLGMGLVTAFSVGLALVLVGVGIMAALGSRQLERSSRFNTLLARAPWFSLILVTLLGLRMFASGATAYYNHTH